MEGKNSARNRPQRSQSDEKVAVMIGPIGGGKTTLFNGLCGTNHRAGISKGSLTKLWAKEWVRYGKTNVALFDGPGTNFTKKCHVQKNSNIIRNGLQFEPLNAILIVIPFEPRTI